MRAPWPDTAWDGPVDLDLWKMNPLLTATRRFPGAWEFVPETELLQWDARRQRVIETLKEKGP